METALLRSLPMSDAITPPTPSQFLQIWNSPLTDGGQTGIINNRTRRYLSWIEDLTTNQGVIGSNPIRRTTQIKGSFRSPFLLPKRRLMADGISRTHTVYAFWTRSDPLKHVNDMRLPSTAG